MVFGRFGGWYVEFWNASLSPRLTLLLGITIGAVVVPQGMAYAKLANLPVQFGLYSAFIGVLIYWVFGTSKDITIGPVAVMSTVTGTIITEVTKAHPQYKNHPEVIASAVAIISGAIIFFLGLIRLGWIVDFISLTAVSAFITGSAISIAVGQVPTLLGQAGVPTRGAAYHIFIEIVSHLGRARLDAAMGLTALTMLYLIRFTCNFMAKRVPNHRKLIFFISTLRTVFVILLYTMISWLVNRHHRTPTTAHKFVILGSVPRGFTDVGVPVITTSMIGDFASQLPVAVIVLLIEHISIAKSFGRINNYTIDPSQELLAIGFTNLIGPFFGAYPVTGSFSRTAIKSKAGVRTPMAGVITALVVLLAIYALPAVFFYIPNSVLAAVIIHAVGDLIVPPNTIYQFWKISPLEVIIFFAGIFVTVFSSIENGIYTTICVSLALLLFRLAKARGRFLGRVKVHSVVGDHLLGRENGKKYKDNAPKESNTSTRNVFLPLDHNDGSNPEVDLAQPYPGIFIYRFSEGFNYPNANHYFDYMIEQITRQTRRTNVNQYAKRGDRPWNDPGPRRGRQEIYDTSLPTLKAVILDFSSVNNVDVTSVQLMIDIRNQLDRYAAPDHVEWHIACINNRWTKRALASAGFGYPDTQVDPQFHRWKPIYSVAEIGGSSSAAAAAERDENEKRRMQDVEARPTSSASSTSEEQMVSADVVSNELHRQITSSKAYAGASSSHPQNSKDAQSRVAVLHGLDRPFFHIDLTSALTSAIASVEGRGKDGRELDNLSSSSNV